MKIHLILISNGFDLITVVALATVNKEMMPYLSNKHLFKSFPPV